MVKKVDGLILLIWVYIVIALPPFSILYLMKSPSAESDLFLEFTNKTPDFPTIIISAIILPAIGALISISRKKLELVFFWQLNKQKRIHIATTAFLLSIVLWKFFSVLNNLNYFGLLILFIFFLLYLPAANNYLSSVNFNQLKLFITRSKDQSMMVVVKNILFALVVLLIIHTSVLVADGQIRAYNYYQLFLSRHPQIKTISPEIVYYGNKVIITGREFGWRGSVDTKFKYKEGQIYIDLWTDTKVIFTVPLHWKLGEINIWLEKPIEWNGKNINVRSNEIKLYLISRDNNWDTEDDAYFEQLKHLGNEALKLNGYAPNP